MKKKILFILFYLFLNLSFVFGNQNTIPFENGLFFKVIEEQESGLLKFKIISNLPDETELVITLENTSYYGGNSVKVKNGIAESDCFSNKGKRLSKGTYHLEIVSVFEYAQENEKVREILGEGGKNLKGKYVSTEVDPFLNKKNTFIKYNKDIIIK